MSEQLALPIPPPQRPASDFTAKSRAELNAALAKARAAIGKAPWDRREQGYWRVVAPQMSAWLPDAERERFLGAFMPELDRIDGLLA